MIKEAVCYQVKLINDMLTFGYCRDVGKLFLTGSFYLHCPSKYWIKNFNSPIDWFKFEKIHSYNQIVSLLEYQEWRKQTQWQDTDKKL